MPLRSNPSLWFNLPGVVAAYQPVRAPDSLSARYNMARGGDNRHRAELGVLPTWSAVTGWTFDGVTTYLAIGILPQTGFSHLAQYVDASGTGYICGTSNAYNYFAFQMRASDGTVPGYVLYSTGSAVSVDPRLLTGNLGLAGEQPYRNGIADGAAIAYAEWSATQEMYIGGINLVGSLNSPGAFTLRAYSIYSRPLVASEMWQAARQMAYCDVNPDWSAWGRRRQYYFAPTTVAFQAAWAERANRLLGGN